MTIRLRIPTDTLDDSEFAPQVDYFAGVGDGVAGTDFVVAEGTDDSALLQSTLESIAARGSSKLMFGAKRYMFDLPDLMQILVDMRDITFEGVEGKTVFDFSRTGGFYNGAAGMDLVTVPNGFIKTAGSKHTEVMLTNDTIVSIGSAGLITAGSRSGTTISITTSAPHGLAVGNLVWVLGDPSITDDDDGDVADGTNDQSCFYTVGISGRTVGRTVPVRVTAVTSTTFDFEYAGADVGDMDTVMSVTATANVFHASDVMEVPDSSIYARGERLLLGSLRERGRDNEHCNIGEPQIVAKILNSTMVRFQGNVRETYAVADGARVFKLDEISNLTFRGITFVGKGHNIETVNSHGTQQRGDTCLFLQYIHNLTVERCTFIDCDLQSVALQYCSKGRFEKNTIIHDKRDEAGGVSGVIDIQYGFNIGVACDDMTFDGNTIFGGRHAIVQGGSTSNTDFGVARVMRFINNHCVGQWLEAISTHQGADTLIYTGNIIEGSRGGINPRYAKKVIITGNIIDVMNNGVIFFNDVLDLVCSGNIITAGSYCVWMKSIDNPTANVQPDGYSGNAAKLSGPTDSGPSIRITENQFTGGTNCVYCIDTTPGLRMDGITIDNNSFRLSSGEPVRVSVGNPATVTVAIASGTYDSATGITTMVLAAESTLARANVPFTLSGLTGTGGFAGLNGVQAMIAPTATDEFSVTTVYFKGASGLGASTITGGTITYPLGGWTGSISNNQFYDCGLSSAAYQLRISNAMSVRCDGNQWFGTSSFAYAILVEGETSTACSFMGGSMAATLYSTALFSSGMKGTGHRTDLQVHEDVTISGGVAAIRFASTKHIRVRGEAVPAADDLDSITGMDLYQEVLLWTQSSLWDFTAKQGAGFQLDGSTDKVIDHALDNLRVVWNGTKCVQTSTFMNHA